MSKEIDAKIFEGAKSLAEPLPWEGAGDMPPVPSAGELAGVRYVLAVLGQLDLPSVPTLDSLHGFLTSAYLLGYAGRGGESFETLAKEVEP